MIGRRRRDVTDDSVSSTSLIRSRRDRGARQQHDDEGRHHDGHQDLDEVAEEREERADLHRAVLDPEGSEPEHRDARHVEHEHHDREHEGEQTTGAQRGVGELLVGDREALDLDALAHEGADDADAGQLLAHAPG